MTTTHTDSAAPPAGRDDYTLMLLGDWRTPEPAAAAQAAAAAWRHVEWPAELLSHSSLISEDDRLAPLSLVRSRAAFDHFDKARWVRHVDETVAGIEHAGVRSYRPYRSVPGPCDAPVGCLVIVTFDCPSVEAAQRWIDAVADASSRAAPVEGHIASRFHIEANGATLINYAEWDCAESHRDAATRPRESADAAPVADVIDNAETIRNPRVERFSRWLTTTPGSDTPSGA